MIMLIHQRQFNVTTKNNPKRKCRIMNNYNQHDLLIITLIMMIDLDDCHDALYVHDGVHLSCLRKDIFY
jgi:hypothetical protein